MFGKIGSLAEKVFTLGFWLISLVVFLAELVLTVAANTLWPSHDVWQKVGSEIGSFLMATVALAFLWDAFGKRAFLAEILEKTAVAAQLHFAGIWDYLPNYHKWPGWTNAFQTSDTLDILQRTPLPGSRLSERTCRRLLRRRRRSGSFWPTRTWRQW
jgi:hypothetical protein